MGEGWGEGGYDLRWFPLPYIPSRQGRGVLWSYFLGNAIVVWKIERLASYKINKKRRLNDD